MVKPSPGFRRERMLREHGWFPRRMEQTLKSCARPCPMLLKVVFMALKRKGCSLLHLERASPDSLKFCKTSTGSQSQLSWRIVCLHTPWANLDAFFTAPVRQSWSCSHSPMMNCIHQFHSGWSSRVPIHFYSTTTFSTCTPWQPISMLARTHPPRGFFTSWAPSLPAGTPHGELFQGIIFVLKWTGLVQMFSYLICVWLIFLILELILELQLCLWICVCSLHLCIRRYHKFDVPRLPHMSTFLSEEEAHIMEQPIQIRKGYSYKKMLGQVLTSNRWNLQAHCNFFSFGQALASPTLVSRLSCHVSL